MKVRSSSSGPLWSTVAMTALFALMANGLSLALAMIMI